MKHHIITLILACLIVSLQAQNEAQEAEKAIQSASSAIKSKKYQDALLELNKARGHVGKLFYNEVIALLPEKVGNWEPQEGRGMEMNMGMSNSIQASRIYSDKNWKMPDAGNMEEGERPDPMAFIKPQITLSVSNDTNMGSEVGMAHSNQNPFQDSPNESSEPIKVGKYRALKKLQPNMRSGSLTIVVGAAIVNIQAMGIEDGKVLDDFAAALDIEKIKGIFGE